MLQICVYNVKWGTMFQLLGQARVQLVQAIVYPALMELTVFSVFQDTILMLRELVLFALDHASPAITVGPAFNARLINIWLLPLIFVHHVSSHAISAKLQEAIA